MKCYTGAKKLQNEFAAVNVLKTRLRQHEYRRIITLSLVLGNVIKAVTLP
jgi:hypothetical protein